MSKKYAFQIDLQKLVKSCSKVELDMLLGEGTSGQAYKTCKRRVGDKRQAIAQCVRPQAVKIEIFKPHKPLKGQKRTFLKEVRIAKLASRRGFGVHVYDASICQNKIGTMLMDLYTGSLSGQPWCENAQGLLKQFTAMYDEMHKSNIVHADLWPKNIFYKQDAGKEIEIKFADFGLSFSKDKPPGNDHLEVLFKYNSEQFRKYNKRHRLGLDDRWLTLEKVQSNPFLLDEAMLRIISACGNKK